MEETKKINTRIINVEANSNNDLFELIENAKAQFLSIYVKNTYCGIMTTKSLIKYNIIDIVKQIYIMDEAGAFIWCDALHIVDIEKSIIYIYSMKESEFYEQEM